VSEAGGDGGWDPSLAPCLRRFRVVQEATECVYAPGTVLWGCPDYDAELSLERNLATTASVFARFGAESRERRLDGLVLELPGAGYSETVEQLAHTTDRALRYLGANDPAGNALQAEIDDPSWWFSFAGQRLFCLTTGVCYERTNSRFGFNTGHTYLMFQPDHAFSRRNPGGDSQAAREARVLIRDRYRQAGRPYDLDITLGPLEALRYVKPARNGDPPVRWWEG